MQLLEITKTKRAFIRYVAEKAQESFLRIHEGKSVYSPKMSLVLRKLGLTYDEYVDYSSEYFYNYQLIFEDPIKIKDMPKDFISSFLAYTFVYESILRELAGDDDFEQLVRELFHLNNLKPDILNLN